MTKKKSLKRRIRALAAEESVSYTAALAKLRARRAAPSKLIAGLPEVSPMARANGLPVRAYASLALWEELGAKGVERALARLSEVLAVLAPDPAAAVLRSALLGDVTVLPARPKTAHVLLSVLAARHAFGRRLALGLRGLSEDGRAVAFDGSPLTRCIVASLDQDRRDAPVLYLWLGDEWERAPSYSAYLDSTARRALQRSR